MRRSLLALPLAAALAGPVSAAQEAPVLVELFTSQGCNSCPPADSVLAELAARPDVLALAFHVTYWDRLGWKDSFGDQRYTDRQYAYAEVLGSDRVYTPQAVVAGQGDVVGSSRSRLLQAIAVVREHGTARLATIGEDGTVTLPVPAGADTTLWAAAWDDAQKVAIGAGENAGRVIDYRQVVRWLRGLDPADPRLPMDMLKADGRNAVAVVLQRRSDGAVLAVGQRRL